MATKVINTILNLKDNMSSGLIKAARNTDKVSNEMVAATRSVVSFGNKAGSAIKGVVKNFATAGVAAASAFAAFSFKSGMEFEEQMSRVASISGATEQELQGLTEAARNMGMTTKFTATESGQALEYMAMAGWKADQMIAGLPGIMNLAAASGEELSAVSDIVTDALTAFGLTASDAAHFSDVLAQTASNANTNVGLMGETFQYAAPVAGSLGYSVEDTAVAIGLMANAGIKGSNAGTALRGMLSNLAKPSDQVASYMDDLGISLTDVSGEIKPLSELMGDLRRSFSTLTEAQKAEYASGIAGKNAMSGLLAIVNASDEDFNKLTQAIAESDGAAQRMADTANDNLRGDLTLLGSAAESVGVTFYNAFQEKARGAVQSLTDKLTEMQQDGTIDEIVSRASEGLAALLEKGEAAVSWLIENREPVVATLKTLAAALGIVKLAQFGSGVMQAVKTISLFGKTVGLLVAANPVVLFVAAAVAAGALIIANWDTVKSYARDFCDTVGGFFSAVGEDLSNCWNGAKQALQDFFSWAGEKLSWLDEKVSSIPILGSVYTGAKSLGSTIRDWATTPLSAQNVPGHALGTSYFGGGLTRVHERGGEIMRLPSGTQIIPHDLSRRAVGGSSVTVHVTVQGNVIGNEEYADEMGERIAGEIIRALDNT